jgi:hypothetical protein
MTLDSSRPTYHPPGGRNVGRKAIDAEVTRDVKT